MAVSSILIPPDANRDRKARELAKTAHTWHYVTLNKPWGAFPAGTVCRQTPNGYRVTTVACTCPDYLDWSNICKHVRCMVILEQQAQQIDAAAPSLISLRDLYPACAAACGQIVPQSNLLWCDDCSAARERSERLAAARRRVVEALVG
jgi:hypothetical protein